jgi:hypothetical protein
LLAVAPAGAQAINPADLFGDGPLPFSHSTGLYMFIPPQGWSCQQLRDSSVECQTNNGPAPGTMRITHMTIEGDLDAELMALNAERDLKKLPHYRKSGGGRLLLGTTKAALRSFQFDYLGNTELPVAVEELYVVTGAKAIRLHFETMARSMPAYMQDLKLVYDTFGVAEVDAAGQVVQVAKPRQQAKRRR